MSNLTITAPGGFTFSCKFDILRGWPFGGAIEESFQVKTGDTLKEGQLAEFDGTTGKLKLMATSSDTTLNNQAELGINRAVLVIQGNDQYDAKFVGKVVTLRGPVTIKTEKYTGAVNAGDYLTWDTSSNYEGYLKTAVVADSIVVGRCLESDSVNGYIVAALNL